MIKIKELSKKYDSVYAVKDLTFDIEDGKVVGLLGPNGAGKTTTMRLMTGYISPDAGDVLIDGVSVVTHPQEIQKEIGYMPETNPLYGDMLVSEALDFFADLKGIPGSTRRDAFDFVVNAVSLDDVFYRPIKELSKGYKQRVGLAVALLHKPKTLILDEPTEGLDPNQRTDIRALIKELAVDRTIIMSTHVMQEAQAVCDHLYIIAKGSLVANGTTKELSQTSEKKQTFEVDIEGKKVVEELKKIKGVEDVKVAEKKSDRVSATVVMSADVAFQPELSKISGKLGWTTWKCVEKEEKLEDVFYKLTNAS